MKKDATQRQRPCHHEETWEENDAPPLAEDEVEAGRESLGIFVWGGGGGVSALVKEATRSMSSVNWRAGNVSRLPWYSTVIFPPIRSITLTSLPAGIPVIPVAEVIVDLSFR